MNPTWSLEDGPLLIDVDGVLADFAHAILALAAEKYNVFAQPSDCNKDPIWDAIGCPYLPPAIDDAIRDREFVYRMKPIPGALDFLRTLENTYGPDNVEICTAPWQGKGVGQWSEQRYSWLKDVAKVAPSRIHMTSRKYRIAGILIDDSEKHLIRRKPGERYCIAQPYNIHLEGVVIRGGYRECLDWLKGTVNGR